jgi:hypothetical protein
MTDDHDLIDDISDDQGHRWRVCSCGTVYAVWPDSYLTCPVWRAERDYTDELDALLAHRARLRDRITVDSTSDAADLARWLHARDGARKVKP